MAARIFAQTFPRAALRAAAPVRMAVPRSMQLTAPKRFSSTSVNVKDPLLAEQEHAKEHAVKSADLWRKITMYICVPGAAVMAVFIYQIEAEHIHHRDHDIAMNNGELPEEGAPKYDYQNIRKKPFPWGMQSFFFNPKANYPASL